MKIPILLLHVALCIRFSTSLSSKLLACQLQKPENLSPLLGCPSETVFVSPSDNRAHFKSVQEAVISLYVVFKLML